MRNKTRNIGFCVYDEFHHRTNGTFSFVPNGNCNAVQHLQYMPYGESFIDQRATSHDIRFKFTGKERDSETGFDYFGARYYSSGLSIWLSVDPLASKYPGLSPYMYCAGNPVMLVDPDGRLIDEYELNIETGEMKNIAQSDNDVVYAISLNDEGDATRTGDKVEFDGKPITDNRVLGISNEGKPEQLIAVSNIADGEKLFRFVKEQTGENQEWSILDYTLNGNSSQSLITTSGLKSSEPRGSSFGRQIANTNGASILRFDHNHPDSSTSEWSSNGDRLLRDIVLKNNSNASVNIHFKSGDKWTSRSIINDTKHHYRGEFN